MRRFHLIVGLGGVAAFLASGLYMHFLHDHLRGMSDARRLLYRSTHIYLLLASLANIAYGLYARPAPVWRRYCQTIGSCLILAGPPLLAGAFLTEPWLTDLDRPYTRPAIWSCLAGTVLHLLSQVPALSASQDSSSAS